MDNCINYTFRRHIPEQHLEHKDLTTAYLCLYVSCCPPGMYNEMHVKKHIAFKYQSLL